MTSRIDFESAKKTASVFIGQPASESFSYVILDEYAIERPNCFVFFYESSRYLETDRFEDRLVGNAPVLIDRATGAPRFLGTADPVEIYIEQFEGQR